MVKATLTTKELEDLITQGKVTLFRTKKETTKAAKLIGWSGKCVKIERRFEDVWIVGEIKDFILSIPQNNETMEITLGCF